MSDFEELAKKEINKITKDNNQKGTTNKKVDHNQNKEMFGINTDMALMVAKSLPGKIKFLIFLLVVSVIFNVYQLSWYSIKYFGMLYVSGFVVTVIILLYLKKLIKSNKKSNYKK
jgi:hypothetical protein